MATHQNIRYRLRAPVSEQELQALFIRAWGEAKGDFQPVLARSFTWVTADVTGMLVGFVNLAWDGGVHFFLLDTTVDPAWQRQGIGTALVRTALAACAGQGEWVHVDYDAELETFYEACGFEQAHAGVVSVKQEKRGQNAPE